jgi:predicted N-acyltransferase
LQLTVRTVQDIREIPEELWDATATPGALICTHRFLRAVQDSQVNDCCFFYPMVYADGRLVAHASMYLITSELDMFGEGLMGRVVERIARCFPSLTRFFCLECGTPVALGSTISIAPDVHAPTVLSLLAEEAKRLAAEHATDGILFRDFLDDELGRVQALEEQGFRRVPNLPMAMLDVAWRTPHAYEAGLRHAYRRSYRRRVKQWEESGLSSRVVTDFAPLADVLAGLWRQTYDRAKEYRRELLKPVFFERMSTELGEDSAVLLIERNDQPLAFALLLREGNRMIWPYCGLDYGENEQYELYFNLLYAIVRQAIEAGASEIDMGITTLDAKKRVGASVRPLHMFMYHRNPLLRRVAPRLFSLLTPGDTTPDHRVFRQLAGTA